MSHDDTKRANPSAFPILKAGATDGGMNLLDYFAGQVLPQCYERDHGNFRGKGGMDHVILSARAAYDMADAMLLERDKR